ncbi:MAG: response regulator transcription factor [Acidaminococcaceae bacterium]
MQAKVLLVDDEENIRMLVRFNLEKAGYVVVEAADGVTALDAVRTEAPNLVLLDLMLPGLDGLEVCRLLKSKPQTAGLPIIMLTAKSEEIDRVLGLELGADDYLTKPFGQRELVARVKAVLRRSQGADKTCDHEVVFGELRLNRQQYAAYLGEEQLALTPKEFELLKLLTENPGQAFSREQLLTQLWGYEYYGDTRTVDVHVRHLRAKLERIPHIAQALATVRGIGYRFVPPTS